MSNNLIWIFSVVSIMSSILLLISSIRLFKMRREIDKLEVENSLLKLQVDNCIEHVNKADDAIHDLKNTMVNNDL